MKKNLIIGLLLGFFATFLMSHNVSAAGVRLGSYTNYVSNGVSFSPNPSNGIEHNRDYSLTATRDTYIYIANGNFILPSTYNLKADTKYYLTIVQNFKSQVSSGANGSTFLSEPFDVYNDYAYTISDTINSSRSCSSSTVCNFTFVHNIELQGIGNGTANFSSTGNLFSTSGWTQTNGGTGVFNWTGFIFEDYDEWVAFRNSVISELSGIHSDTTDIVDTLGEINDKLDALDNNADANAQGWENMQNTDGLIDVGDNTSFMDTFNSINSFFGGMKNVSATDCSFDFSNDVVDLGVLNFCSMPEALRNIISPIAAIIFSVVDIFLAWGSIKYIVSIIDWARRN